jgi:membrane protein YqaA with SNARE-associated domain
VARARDDAQVLFCAERLVDALIERDHRRVEAADDEKRGRAHMMDGVAGEIRAPAARNDGCNIRIGVGGRDHRGAGARAGAEIADPQSARSLVLARPLRRHIEPGCEQIDVEHVGAILLLLRRQQVDEKRAESCPLQFARDEIVAWAKASAAAAVRENDKPRGPCRYVENGFAAMRADDDVFLANYCAQRSARLRFALPSEFSFDDFARTLGWVGFSEVLAHTLIGERTLANAGSSSNWALSSEPDAVRRPIARDWPLAREDAQARSRIGACRPSEMAYVRTMVAFKNLRAALRQWTQGGSPPVVAGAVGFLEASFVFVNLEPLIVPMMAARGRGVWLLAGCCVAGNILACLLMYSLGAFLAEPLIEPLVRFLGAEDAYRLARVRLMEAGFTALFLIGVSPFPTQIETAAAGAIAYPLIPYLFAFVVARSVRYAALAAIVRVIGLRASAWIEKYQLEIFLAGIVLTAGLVVIVFAS